MKERPILFSGPMVRAILDGRKTMTRRVIKSQPPDDFMVPEEGLEWRDETIGIAGRQRFYCGGYENTEIGVDVIVFTQKCPYGQPGDRLWVRETCLLWYSETQGKRTLGGDDAPIFSEDPEWDELVADGRALRKARGSRCGWEIVPSIHMPRWASRIDLEITDIRVERLQDIGQMDAINEGLTMLTKDSGRLYKFGLADRDGLPGTDDDGWAWQDWSADHAKAFARLWDSINAKRGYGWDTNPLAWVIEFKRIAP